MTQYQLWRTQLCRHPEHGPDNERCVFAHTLAELRAPQESRLPFPIVWQNQQAGGFCKIFCFPVGGRGECQGLFLSHDQHRIGPVYLGHGHAVWS